MAADVPTAARSPLHAVAIELTARCNQKCTYCYNAWRDDGGADMAQLAPDTLRRTVERVVADVSLDHVTLTGGEPFLCKEIHDLIDLINARGIPVRIISNGGMVTEATATRLSRQRVQYVQLTLAGPDAPTHDAVCGTGSFGKTLEAAGILRRQGVAVVGSYLCTVSSHASAAAVLECFQQHGVTQAVFNRFNPSGYSVDAMEALMPTRTMVLKALRDTEAFAAGRGMTVQCTMPIPPCVVDYEQFRAVKFGFCAIGTEFSEYAVGPDGRVRLCTLQKDAVGDLRQEGLPEVLARDAARVFRQQVPEFCTECPYAAVCLGGCGASAEWVLGSARELDPFVARHVMKDFAARARARQTRLPVMDNFPG